MAIAAAVVLLALEAGYLLFMSGSGFPADISHPNETNYGADVLGAAFALAALPIVIGILRQRRLAWYVFVPYEIFALGFMSASTLNG